MNLNNISLPSHLIADLYHHSLVEGNATAMPQTPPVPSLGKGGKGILIVVNKPDVPYLPDSELDFLTKVLLACQLSLADVAIVNWQKAPHHDAESMLEQFKARHIILFDLDAEQFGLPSDLPPYSVYLVQEKRFVAAPSLHQIEKTKEAKGQLWAALKQLFGF
jgi:DNA polymerase III psi subunit